MAEPSCRHPFGCQAPGDGCIGPCPVTVAEAEAIERAYLDAPGDDGKAEAREQIARWITEAASALQAATVITERMHRTGVVEGLNLANHDRLVQSADGVIRELRRALDGDP